MLTLSSVALNGVRPIVGGILTVFSVLLSASNASWALPVTQTLSKGPSYIKFGVDSPAPALQMHGYVRDFNGNVTLHPSGDAISRIQLVVNLNSAQLPPDQLLQGIFLHSVLARFQHHAATFQSTEITRIGGNEYLATGSYTWQRKNRSATIPFQLIRTSPQLTEIRILMRGGLTDATTPKELSASAPGASQSTGWAKAALIFKNS